MPSPMGYDCMEFGHNPLRTSIGGCMGRGTALGLLPVVAAALATAGIVATVSMPERPARPNVVRADEVGATYFSDVATFKARLLRKLERQRGAPPGELRAVVDQQLAAKPTLPPPPPGAEDSQTYQEAAKAQTTLFEPVTDLRAELDGAAQGQVFAKAAKTALDTATDALRASGTTETVESRTLPALREARADFRSVPVPPEAQQAAASIDAALSAAIRELEKSVAELEAEGGVYAFDLTAEFEAAEKALHDYAVVTDGDLAEAVARFRDSV